MKSLLLVLMTLVFSNMSFAQTPTPTAKPVMEKVPLTPQPDMWSKNEKILRFQCKDYKLIARSRFQPTKTYTHSSGLSNDKNCKANIKSVRNTGCFCDDSVLKCMVTQKIEPKGIVCPNLLMCFAWEGESTGLMKVETVSKHYTRQACEKELVNMFDEGDE